MWFRQGNIFTEVSQATDEEVEWLRSKPSGLTYTNRKAFFDAAAEDKTRFFDVLENRFPAGFTEMVLGKAKAAGLDVQLIDARTQPHPVVGAQLAPRGVTAQAAVALGAPLGWLHDDQLEAANIAVAKTRGIVHMATGGGKTEVAIGITELVPDACWLFLVHRGSLLQQTADRYELRTGRMAAQIGGGKKQLGKHFTVATFQTLAAMLRNEPKRAAALLARFTGVIVDECHVLPAASFWNVAMALVNCHWRIGISATPLDRSDQRSVYSIAALGSVIYRKGAAALIAEGRLAKPSIFMVKAQHEELFVLDTKLNIKKRPKYATLYKRQVVKSLHRNRIVCAIAVKAQKPALLFVKDISHGKALLKALTKRGLRADFVWGKASLEVRAQRVKELARGDNDVLICSVIFQEGLDIPVLRSVLIAAGEQSVIAALQRLGRGTRTTETKTTFEVWDVWDVGEPILERHSRSRKRTYIREKYSVRMVQMVPHTLDAKPPQRELL